MKQHWMNVLSDARWVGAHGIGRFAGEVLRRFPEHMQLVRGPNPLSPVDPAWLSAQAFAKRPAVFFSPGFNPPPVCPAALVFTIHDLIHIDVHGEGSLAKRLYYETVVKPACHRAHRVLTVSEYSRSRIIAWSGVPESQVVNIGNGVGPPFEPEGPRYRPDFPYALYVGNSRPHKNLQGLLVAFREVACPELRLVVAGCARAAVATEVQRLGIEKRVETMASPTDEELAAVYRGALFLVMPSLVEGFGLPALEAMACGVPVIASKNTSVPEVVGDAAISVDPLDPSGIAAAMGSLLGDDTRRDSMRRLGIDRARRFPCDEVAAKARKAIENALTAAQTRLF